jgi:type IV secretory pathway VirB6-like protein
MGIFSRITILQKIAVISLLLLSSCDDIFQTADCIEPLDFGVTDVKTIYLDSVSDKALEPAGPPPGGYTTRKHKKCGTDNYTSTDPDYSNRIITGINNVWYDTGVLIHKTTDSIGISASGMANFQAATRKLKYCKAPDDGLQPVTECDETITSPTAADARWPGGWRVQNAAGSSNCIGDVMASFDFSGPRECKPDTTPCITSLYPSIATPACDIFDPNAQDGTLSLPVAGKSSFYIEMDYIDNTGMDTIKKQAAEKVCNDMMVLPFDYTGCDCTRCTDGVDFSSGVQEGCKCTEDVANKIIYTAYLEAAYNNQHCIDNCYDCLSINGTKVVNDCNDKAIQELAPKERYYVPKKGLANPNNNDLKQYGDGIRVFITKSANAGEKAYRSDARYDLGCLLGNNVAGEADVTVSRPAGGAQCVARGNANILPELQENMAKCQEEIDHEIEKEQFYHYLLEVASNVKYSCKCLTDVGGCTDGFCKDKNVFANNQELNTALYEYYIKDQDVTDLNSRCQAIFKPDRDAFSADVAKHLPIDRKKFECELFDDYYKLSDFDTVAMWNDASIQGFDFPDSGPGSYYTKVEDFYTERKSDDVITGYDLKDVNEVRTLKFKNNLKIFYMRFFKRLRKYDEILIHKGAINQDPPEPEKDNYGANNIVPFATATPTTDKCHKKNYFHEDISCKESIKFYDEDGPVSGALSTLVNNIDSNQDVSSLGLDEWDNVIDHIEIAPGCNIELCENACDGGNKGTTQTLQYSEDFYNLPTLKKCNNNTRDCIALAGNMQNKVTGWRVSKFTENEMICEGSSPEKNAYDAVKNKIADSKTKQDQKRAIATDTANFIKNSLMTKGEVYRCTGKNKYKDTITTAFTKMSNSAYINTECKPDTTTCISEEIIFRQDPAKCTTYRIFSQNLEEDTRCFTLSMLKTTHGNDASKIAYKLKFKHTKPDALTYYENCKYPKEEDRKATCADDKANMLSGDYYYGKGTSGDEPQFVRFDFEEEYEQVQQCPQVAKGSSEKDGYHGKYTTSGAVSLWWPGCSIEYFNHHDGGDGYPYKYASSNTDNAGQDREYFRYNTVEFQRQCNAPTIWDNSTEDGKCLNACWDRHCWTGRGLAGECWGYCARWWGWPVTVDNAIGGLKKPGQPSKDKNLGNYMFKLGSIDSKYEGPKMIMARFERESSPDSSPAISKEFEIFEDCKATTSSGAQENVADKIPSKCKINKSFPDHITKDMLPAKLLLRVQDVDINEQRDILVAKSEVADAAECEYAATKLTDIELGDIDNSIAKKAYSNNNGKYLVKIASKKKDAITANLLHGIMVPFNHFLEEDIQKLFYNNLVCGIDDCSNTSEIDDNGTIFIRSVQLLLVFYIAFTALTFLMGITNITQGDLVYRLIKIAIILTLISPTSWEFYNLYVIGLFSNTAESLGNLLASSIAGTGTEEGIQYCLKDNLNKCYATKPMFEQDLNPIDQLYIKKTTAITEALTNLDELISMLFQKPLHFKALAMLSSPAEIGWLMVIMTYYAFALAFFASIKAVILYVVIKLIMALLFMVGPIFIIFVLFEKTKSIFKAWLGMLVSYSLQLIFLVMVVSIFTFLIISMIYNVFFYGVCWGTLWYIDLPISSKPIEFLSWWRVWGYSESYTTTLNASLGASFVEIVVLYIMAFLFVQMTEKITEVADKMASGGGGSGGAGSMSAGIMKDLGGLLSPQAAGRAMRMLGNVGLGSANLGNMAKGTLNRGAALGKAITKKAGQAAALPGQKLAKTIGKAGSAMGKKMGVGQLNKRERNKLLDIKKTQAQAFKKYQDDKIPGTDKEKAAEALQKFYKKKSIKKNIISEKDDEGKKIKLSTLGQAAMNQASKKQQKKEAKAIAKYGGKGGIRENYSKAVSRILKTEKDVERQKKAIKALEQRTKYKKAYNQSLTVSEKFREGYKATKKAAISVGSAAYKGAAAVGRGIRHPLNAVSYGASKAKSAAYRGVAAMGRGGKIAFDATGRGVSAVGSAAYKAGAAVGRGGKAAVFAMGRGGKAVGLAAYKAGGKTKKYATSTIGGKVNSTISRNIASDWKKGGKAKKAIAVTKGIVATPIFAIGAAAATASTTMKGAQLTTKATAYTLGAVAEAGFYAAEVTAPKKKLDPAKALGGARGIETARKELNNSKQSKIDSNKREGKIQTNYELTKDAAQIYANNHSQEKTDAAMYPDAEKAKGNIIFQVVRHDFHGLSSTGSDAQKHALVERKVNEKLDQVAEDFNLSKAAKKKLKKDAAESIKLAEENRHTTPYLSAKDDYKTEGLARGAKQDLQQGYKVVSNLVQQGREDWNKGGVSGKLKGSVKVVGAAAAAAVAAVPVAAKTAGAVVTGAAEALPFAAKKLRLNRYQPGKATDGLYKGAKRGWEEEGKLGKAKGAVKAVGALAVGALETAPVLAKKTAWAFSRDDDPTFAPPDAAMERKQDQQMQIDKVAKDIALEELDKKQQELQAVQEGPQRYKRKEIKSDLKVKRNTAKAMLNANRINAKIKISTLESQLSQLQEGGRNYDTKNNALNDAKQELTVLTTKVNELDS